MTSKKRGLGRGLDALLSVGAGQLTDPVASDEHLRAIPVERIQRGRYQPRANIKTESLEELTHSIKSEGVMQPILVRPLLQEGRYELIAGERRWRAAQLAGLDTVPAIVRRVADAKAMSIALIENIQREQLNPLDEATAFERLAREFDMTHQQIAESVGRSRTAVTNLMRLLELEPRVKALVENGVLEMGHARALLSVTGAMQVECAEKIERNGLSVRAAEALVRSLAVGKSRRGSVAEAPDPDILQLERSLSDRLGTRVAIKHGPSGKGTLTIRYGSTEELDGILAHIK